MNRIKVGEIYMASTHRLDKSGENKWEMIKFTNQDGKDPITCWVEKDHIPSGVHEGGNFQVVSILGYTHKMHKNEYKGTVKWEEDNSVEVIVKPISDSFDGDTSFDGAQTTFEDMKNVDPFAGVNPFAGVDLTKEDPDDLPF